MAHTVRPDTADGQAPFGAQNSLATAPLRALAIRALALYPESNHQEARDMTFGKGHHLHLIDGSAFIFRAYHALPPL
ncbi:MAG: hypothetical protein ACI9IV_001651, partial [Paracoccaceae bacterium]